MHITYNTAAKLTGIRRSVIACLLASWLAACDKPPSPVAHPLAALPGTAANTTPAATTPTSKKQSTPAGYVGSTTCQQCHAAEYAAWQISDHHHAMAVATPDTVLGAFPSALNHHHQTTRFTRTNDQFTIKTDTNTNQPAELTLRYTFGIFPLQQYLVEQPGGALQSLPFAWDSRPANAGGQRWFHLYDQEPITPGDVLHWRSNSHNANHMCIECHTTNFSKQVQDDAKSFRSTWQELGVGCESCHGPGSQHIAWSTGPAQEKDPNKGWAFRLTSGSSQWWQPQAEGHPPKRTTQGDDVQVNRCAQCHSRRSRIDPANDKPELLDAFMPSLLERGLYYPDGQIHDEVYEYGSFLQSKMFQAGVTCSNCHNPHTGKTKIEGNGLCLQCHDARHDTPQHTLHPTGSPGSACVDCHMPSTTYMQVDARRDHSFHIPRPTLESSIHAPTACQSCHADKPADWAAAVLAQKGLSSSDEHKGTVLYRAQQNLPNAYDDLVALLGNPEQPVMRRATAASLLSRFPTRDYLRPLSMALGSAEALVRLGALQACDNLPAEQRGNLLPPLLLDARKAIRIEAARLLSVLPEAKQIPGYPQARDEYLASLQLNRDRAAAQVSMATLAMHEARWADAEHALRTALTLEPWFVPATVNLSDLLRGQARDDEAGTVLNAALTKMPTQPDLALAYGLYLVRQQRTEEAMRYLHTASEHSEDPYYHYVYALALQQQHRTSDALAVLQQATDSLAWSRDIQMARADIAWQQQQLSLVKQYLDHWLQTDPDDPAARAWQQKINTAPASSNNAP